MKKYSLLVLMIVFGNLIFAGNIVTNDSKVATKQISGKVIDKKSGEEIAGAEIKIAEKTIYTDLNGNFSTNISMDQAEAIITFVSYTDTKINIDPHSYNEIIVELESK